MAYRNNPLRSLLRRLHRSSGRNNTGVITVRHRGGAHKRRYRAVDFSYHPGCYKGRLERVEYDPNRSARIALVQYGSGSRRYIISPQDAMVGMEVASGNDAPVRPGCSLPLSKVPVGTSVHNLEMRPGAGAQIARAAGAYATVISANGANVTVRLRSGEVRSMDGRCYATVGAVGNAGHSRTMQGKAGRMRWRGVRPTVRGVAMNPVDHPHGGGEGKTTAGRHPVSPWGQHTKGLKTRRSKGGRRVILHRREYE
ncbi:50S ribosomal protein L2 [Candidatus Tremblaya princeps]|uniref:Large ribosomal subunit protein uL2 n=1 Tax=Tremblaya princeps TaxID=189385 RepID=A0A1C3K936_TREPR|nr:50S ribosomal protein L2 [Candidatus Tremblaya princeps]